MNREEKIAAIRQKCIEANPDREWVVQTIRLADVLLAIEKSDNDQVTFVDAAGFFYADYLQGNGIEPQDVCWNLPKDDLNEQSEECLDFLAELLAHEQ